MAPLKAELPPWHPDHPLNRNLPRCPGCGRRGVGGRVCADCLERKRRVDRALALETPRVCAAPGCENEFVPGETHGKYCSNACRQRAYNARKRAAAER